MSSSIVKQQNVGFQFIRQITEIVIAISDNGKGIDSEKYFDEGNGLIGMKERLEFVNGTLEMVSKNGTTVTIRVPNFVKQEEEETV